LEWQQKELSCEVSFSAYDGHGDCYSVNTLTGVVLVNGNGLPPHQELPTSITRDEATVPKRFCRQQF